ncbi:hypothetical protein SEPCBS119000_004088 [Sporothrix epigloea]|uniref:Killer toxin Kp4 domain-containing protein n=1 Tax=Sporothrix epigloea TaxID=1892477 RepID=A0ABP0DUA3_9PEZI
MQLFTLAMYIASATALGINCRGSSFCTLGGAKITDVQGQIGDMIALGYGDRYFNSGDQIACAKGKYESICAFFQNGAGGTAQQAFDYIQNLVDHGCTVCGSVPTQDGNDVSTGELTINAVDSPCCKGNCQC